MCCDSQPGQIVKANCHLVSGPAPFVNLATSMHHVQQEFPELKLHVLATDADEAMLQRAERARYPTSSVKDVPADWKPSAFVCSKATRKK